MRLTLLLALLWTLKVQGAPWMELSEDCIAGPGSSEDDAPSLTAACPELSEALRTDPWAELLTVPPEELSVRSVVDLSGIAEHYRETASAERVNTTRLDAALASLPAADVEEPSLWERFREWLLDVLGEDEAGLPEWLEKMSLPDQAVTWIWYGTLIVIVLLALAVVGNEIRLATRRTGTVSAGTASPGAGSLDGFAAVEGGGTPHEQLTALLQRIVDRLEALGRLPRRPSLTHREIAAAPGIPEDQRQAVGEVSRAAERTTYASRAPAPQEVAPALDAGRRLLKALAGADG